MKFISLLKKELREMLNVQTILMLVMMILMMGMMGGLMNKASEETQKESGKITICDQDDTPFSQSVLKFLQHPTADMENDVNIITMDSDDYSKELEKHDVKSFVIIPKGFEDAIRNEKQAEIIYVSRMTSLSMMANINAGSETAVQLIQAAIKTAMYTDKINSGKLTDAEVSLMEAPVSVNEQTIVADKQEKISQLVLYSGAYSQSLFMPMIVYILILLGSQTMVNAVSAEKLDKTLETLLSAPVSRLHVLSAKMIAAAVVALLNAAVYMIGTNKLSFTGGGDLPDEYNQIIENLGLNYSLKTYLLIGVQMLITMLIALSISLILGAFARNIKSSQTLVMPLMIITVIPFMATMFLDISTLPGVIKYLLYAIPFTHTFIASDCVLFGKMGLYVGGLIYQCIVLVVCMAFAVKIFTSDKLFTSKGIMLNFGRKKKTVYED